MRVTTSSVTDDTVGFDGLRAVVGAGDGVVARFPGIVCVARCSDPEPLREFLSVCADVAGPEPGRALARRLATWMSGPDAPGPELRFGTIAAAGDQLAVYLVGEVDARVDAVGGLALSGAHAAIGTDRLLAPPSAPVVLSMDGGDVRADPADVHDLRAGVVPGAGVVLRPTGFGLDDLDHAEERAGGGHEWFDTGEVASDPFADPPRGADVPVQRAAGVRVGGRNGVAREAAPEATSAPEPAGDPAAGGDGGRAGGRVEGRDGVRAEGRVEGRGEGRDGGRVDDSVAGPGRHALDLPLLPRAEPPVGASGDRRIDPLTDPLPDFPAADPEDALAADGGASDPTEPARGGPAEPRADAALEQRRPRPFGGPQPPTFADPAAPPTDPPPTGRAPLERPATPRGHALDDGAHLEAPPAGPVWGGDGAAPDGPSPALSTGRAPLGRPATSRGHALDDGAHLEAPRQVPPATPAWGGDGAAPDGPGSGSSGPSAWGEDGVRAVPSGGPSPDAPPGQALAESPSQAEEAHRDTLPVRGRQPARPPGEPPAAASLFAPAHDQARSTVLAPGATPPGGFAPPAGRAPETRPPPPTDGSTATPPGFRFQPPAEEAATGERRGPRIRGYRCENGHLNDPRSPNCRDCAAPIDERVGGLVAGPRPPLGTLVFDDGTAHVVDGGYLVGVRPDTDDRVRTGELRPIVVADDSVAHAHAEIRVSGWDVMVVDAGSRDGTYVSGPDEGQWTPLPPRRSRRLLPGTRVRLGGRTFVFESSSTVR